MNNQKYIVQFVCYSPKIYSGLDRFFVLLTKKLQERGYTPVFVYGETMEFVPQIQKDLEAAGAVVLTMPEHGKRSMVRAARAIYQKYRPEVVDTHFVNYLKVITALLSRRYKARHFTHIHSLIADSPKQYKQEKGALKCFALNLYYHLLYWYSERVLCVSKAIETQFRHWVSDTEDRVQTLYLGTDLTPSALTKQQARSRLGLPQDELILTNISAKEELKRIDLIINDMGGVKSSHTLED